MKENCLVVWSLSPVMIQSKDCSVGSAGGRVDDMLGMSKVLKDEIRASIHSGISYQ